MGSAGLAVADAPHPLADDVEVIGDDLDPAFALGVHRLERVWGVVDDLVEQARFVDRAAVGDRRGIERHLQGTGWEEALTDRGVDRVAGRPAVVEYLLLV